MLYLVDFNKLSPISLSLSLFFFALGIMPNGHNQDKKTHDECFTSQIKASNQWKQTLRFVSVYALSSYNASSALKAKKKELYSERKCQT